MSMAAMVDSRAPVNYNQSAYKFTLKPLGVGTSAVSRDEMKRK